MMSFFAIFGLFEKKSLDMPGSIFYNRCSLFGKGFGIIGSKIRASSIVSFFVKFLRCRNLGCAEDRLFAENMMNGTGRVVLARQHYHFDMYNAFC